VRRTTIALAALLLANALVLGVGRPRAVSPARAGGRPLKVGLVFDVGGRGDKSFNDMAFAGIERAHRELGVDAEYIEPGDGADRESGVRLFAARGFDLVIGVGFIFSDDLYAVALDYPQVHFACVDYAKFDSHGFVVPPPNMVAVKFREEEGAFLVGAIAALTSASHVLGFVGGMDMPLIHKFEAGYRAGATAVCADCRVLAGYAGTGGDAFKNPQKGKELAHAQYAAGASAIFHAAGTTGLGVFEAARETGRFAIGVDADQWDEAPGRVLTSMTKQDDVALFDVVRDLREGHFEGGVRSFGLRERGIDYVYDAHNRGIIPDEARARVEQLRAEIVAGRIVPPTEVKP
jgi:basic membrane protein A